MKLGERNKKWHEAATLRQTGAGLTPKHLDLLIFIYSYTKRTGIAPTNREACTALGIKGRATVSEYLDILEKSGIVTRVPNLRRNVLVTNRGLRLVRKHVGK